MVVSKQSMINKMIDELKLAKDAQNNHKMIQHIASVKSLCEVILEEEPNQPKKTNEISKQELKAMVGKTQKESSVFKENITDDANGDSIFDF